MIASLLLALILLMQPPQKQDRPERGKPDSVRVERPGMSGKRDSVMHTQRVDTIRSQRPDSARGAAYGTRKDTLTYSGQSAC
jgi:hypothetical protein